MLYKKILTRYCQKVNYGSAESIYALRQIIRTGAEWVEIVPTEYQDSLFDITTKFGTYNASTLSDILGIIDYAKSRGMKVFLKPQILVGSTGSSLGVGETTDDTMLNQWFIDYEAFVLKYATIASMNNVDMLSVSTNLNKVLANSKLQDRWTNLVKKVKEVYKNKLIVVLDASIDYFPAKWITDWSLINAIGFDTYKIKDFAVLGNTSKTIASFKTDIKTKIFADVSTFIGSSGKEVFMTAYGACAGDCLNNPLPKLANLSTSKDVAKYISNYTTVQKNFIQAFAQAAYEFRGDNNVKISGVFLWGWLTDTKFGNQVDNNCYSLQGKTSYDGIYQAFRDGKVLFPLGASTGTTECGCVIDS